MAWVNVIDLFYPVGTVYWTLQGNNNNPATLFGGQWDPIGTITVGQNITLQAWKRSS